MPDHSTPQPLYDSLALAAFYDEVSGSRPDHEFCRNLAANAGRILDLGCGTGTFIISVAPGKDAWAVDPAPGMLARARQKPGADRVHWIEASAGTVRLEQEFDLIVMTGHTFQVFLSRAEQAALFQTIQVHLSRGGRFVFDTRNPDFAGSKERTKEQTFTTIETVAHGQVETWNISTYDADREHLTYENVYRVCKTGETWRGQAAIKYTPLAELQTLLSAAGLQIDHLYGDWDGTAFTSKAKEIVVVGSLAE